MSDLRKAAEMALEALEWNYGTDLCDIENCMAWLDKMNATIPALRQALAQEEKPPVKTYCGGKPNYCTPVDAVNMSQERVDETAKGEHEPIGEVYGWHGIGKGQPMCRFNASEAEMPVGTKLYTSPPKREWVGLTDADKQEAFDETQEASGGFWEFADYLEAKLKEKNT